jgi:hypothetical protein
MPDENEVYLAVPYLNEDGLELYTRLILRKLVSLVITSNANVHDYEQEYNANPEVKVVTIPEDIEPDTVYNIPLSYGVGSHQLRVTVSGYMMYPGVDYEEVGEEGEISNQVKFLTSIQRGSILGVIVYPRQFSFGRNINVSSLVAPELAISNDPTSLLTLDEDGKAIVKSSTVTELIQSNDVSCLHKEGEEDVVGQKTFKTPLKVDLTGIELQDGQTQPVVNLSFNANGMEYNLKPINVIAGSQTDEAYSGALIVGSNTGCTWIGSGESLLNLPSSFSRDGIDFANDESVIVSSDTKISFYVGCANEGSNYMKAAEFLSDGSTRIIGPAFAPTPLPSDNSTRIATTEYVKNVALSIDGDQEIDGQKTFIVSPMAPTPDVEVSGDIVATAQFVKNACVLLYEDQDIPSQKKFLSAVQISNASPTLELDGERSIKGTPPTNRIESAVQIRDRLGNLLGSLGHRYEPSGESAIVLKAVNATSPEANSLTSMGIAVDHQGNARTFAPTPAAGDSSSKIATTKFVYDTLLAFKNALVSALQERLVSGEIEGEGDESPDMFDFVWGPTNEVPTGSPFEPVIPPTPQDPDEPTPDNPDAPNPDEP